MADLTVSGASGSPYPVGDGGDGTPVSDSTNVTHGKTILEMKTEHRVMLEYLQKTTRDLSEQEKDVSQRLDAMKTVVYCKDLIQLIENNQDIKEQLDAYGASQAVKDLQTTLGSIDVLATDIAAKVNAPRIAAKLAEMSNVLNNMSNKNEELQKVLANIAALLPNENCGEIDSADK